MIFKVLVPAATLAGGLPALADEVSVKMLNSGPDGMMVFDPAFVRLKPGDRIKFVPTDKGHNVETIKGMAPDGADYVKSVVGQEAVVTFEREGVCGFKCSPHYMMGMVALVVVGDKRDNLEAAKSAQHNKLTQKRMEPLLAQVQ
ncbi:pseudoazurin [Methylorubrum rhodesianum]|uniref:pseudoazurin n=1 Tax=Methylorubrum TaxID=2282523 RepID=UPI001622354B|nr:MULTISPECIES: pseudoazurin [Methylorubrum]MBB5763337.1 pseudoazurin [Methylorubrum rhodesianum]MBI1691070.1 pseudoazurin [Methylorubrum sp. DB1722]